MSWRADVCHPVAVDLFLPSGGVAALQSSERADRERAGELVDRLQDAIEDSSPKMAAVASEDGARMLSAAVLLIRANSLLREVRGGAGPNLKAFGLRSAFEATLVGRFLLVTRDGPDEFGRRYNESLTEDNRLAVSLGETAPGPVDFLAHLVDASAKRPRDLRCIAQTLDLHDGFSATEPHSSQACYFPLFKFISNTGTHASLRPL